MPKGRKSPIGHYPVPLPFCLLPVLSLPVSNAFLFSAIAHLHANQDEPSRKPLFFIHVLSSWTRMRSRGRTSRSWCRASAPLTSTWRTSMATSKAQDRWPQTQKSSKGPKRTCSRQVPTHSRHHLFPPPRIHVRPFAHFIRR